MSNLLQKFEKIQAQYVSKREKFKRVIEKFRVKKKIDLYGRCSELYDESERLIRELKADFQVTAEGRAHDIVLRTKIKLFKATYKELNELTKPLLQQWAEAIVIALFLALILRNFIFGLYHVPTGSAEKNILVGDRIWGNKAAYFFAPVRRGDLVIFDNPLFNYDTSNALNYYWQRYIGFPVPFLGLGLGPDNWVKRVIAVPGDTIQGTIEDGKTVVYLNGKKLDEPYVNKLPLIGIHKTKGFLPWKNIGPITIPSFLRYGIEPRDYTYDPTKSFEEQPYYLMKPEEIIYKPGTNEPFLKHAFSPEYDYRTGKCMDVYGPYVIPKGKYWVMGDSRKNSVDSRWWLFLDEKLIHGRASFVIYSVDSEEACWLFEMIKHPINFWAKHIRWNRFFKGLNVFQPKD